MKGGVMSEPYHKDPDNDEPDALEYMAMKAEYFNKTTMKRQINCGDRATTIIGGLDGMITATSDRFGSKTYELTYYFGGEVRTAWLREEELCFDALKEPIGLASKIEK